MPQTTSLTAGLLYGACVFTFRVVLGVLREVVLLRLMSRELAVMIEGPVILLAAWFLARWIVRDMPVAPRAAPRLLMGATAFALLMAGEAAIAVFAMNRGLGQHLSAYMTTQGMLELMPQVAFALFPLLHLFRERVTP